MTTFALVSLVNDRAQFANCQASLRSQVPTMPEWLMVEPNTRGWNAAQGLNHGIETVAADWVICVHQDVLFPPGFWQQLTMALAALGDDVGLAGIVGCERSGRFRGHIVDPNGHCFWPSLPHDVLTLYEVLIAVRKRSGLRFCEDVPGFHCYGADLCFEADKRGLRVVAIDAPLVHLSTGKLDQSYERASQWLLAKWGERYGHLLPMPTIIVQDKARSGLFRQLVYRLRRRTDHRSRNRNVCPAAPCAADLLERDRGAPRAGSGARS